MCAIGGVGGVGGWGAADYHDFLNDFGDSIAAGMVVVFFNSDDIGRSLNRFKFHKSELPSPMILPTKFG